jgi:hypothetical protein
LGRREAFEVDRKGTGGSGDSGFVEGDEESDGGESITPEEVILIIEVETDSGGVLRVGVTAEGSTIAAEAVKVEIECLRRAAAIEPTEITRIRPAAIVRMSFC